MYIDTDDDPAFLEKPWKKTADELPEDYALVDVVVQLIGDPSSAGTEPAYRRKRGIWHDNEGRPLRPTLEVTHWRGITRPMPPEELRRQPQGMLGRSESGEWRPFQQGDKATLQPQDDGRWRWVWGALDNRGEQMFSVGDADTREQAIRDCEAAIAWQLGLD